MNKLLSSNTIATSFPTKILDFSMHLYQDTFIGDILEWQNDIFEGNTFNWFICYNSS